MKIFIRRFLIESSSPSICSDTVWIVFFKVSLLFIPMFPELFIEAEGKIAGRETEQYEMLWMILRPGQLYLSNLVWGCQSPWMCSRHLLSVTTERSAQAERLLWFMSEGTKGHLSEGLRKVLRLYGEKAVKHWCSHQRSGWLLSLSTSVCCPGGELWSWRPDIRLHHESLVFTLDLQ